MTQYNPEPAANPNMPAPPPGDANPYMPAPPPGDANPYMPAPPPGDAVPWQGPPPPPPPDQANWAEPPPAPPIDQTVWAGPPPPPIPPAPVPPTAKKRPGLLLTIIGLVVLVVSPAPVAIIGVSTINQVVDAADHATAIPASTAWIGTGDLKKDTYFIWSTTGKLPSSCVFMKGDPADENEIKLEAVDDPISVPGDSAIKPVKQFESTGARVSVRCEDADQDSNVVVMYLIPATSNSMVTKVMVGLGASGLLFLVGLVLVVTQTLRRAAWNNRHLKTAGVIQ